MAAYKYAGRTWNVSAQKAGEQLEIIERRDGSITPQAVVDAARPEGSVLHNLFEWNDEKAAEKYRLSQASTFIRCIVKTSEDETAKYSTYRAFVNINPTGDRQNIAGTYVNIQTALSDPESRDVVLSNAKHEMQTFRRKYAELKELASVFSAIDQLIA